MTTMNSEVSTLRELAGVVRVDLRRHDFKERERLVLETVLDLSFECGREAAVIPRLDDLAELTGMSRGNVHTVIWGGKQETGLVGIGVLSVEGTVYRVLPRSGERTWLVRPSVNLARAEALCRQLRELNGIRQGELLPVPPTLTQTVAEVAVEAALSASTVPDSGTTGGQNSGGSVPDLGTFVPELGTPLSFKRKEAQSTSSLKRNGAVTVRGELQAVCADELQRVPEFRDNAHFQAWCVALEQKWGGWMGTGNAETWAESFGAYWWVRWKREPQRFAAVWSETLSMARERRITNSIGGCAYDLWVNRRVGVPTKGDADGLHATCTV